MQAADRGVEFSLASQWQAVVCATLGGDVQQSSNSTARGHGDLVQSSTLSLGINSYLSHTSQC